MVTKEVVTEVLRGVEVEFGDITEDVVWLRWGDEDMHYLLPLEAAVTIDGEVRGRSFTLYWLMINRAMHVAIDLTMLRETDSGLETIIAAQLRRMPG